MEIVLFKFLRFVLVGFSGVFVDFAITWLAKEKLGRNKYLANSIGFIVAASSNYLLNRLWTFESQNPQVGVEYLKFFAVSLIGLCINNSIIFLLNGRFRVNFYIAKVVAIGITTVWNFTANLLFTF